MCIMGFIKQIIINTKSVEALKAEGFGASAIAWKLGVAGHQCTDI